MVRSNASIFLREDRDDVFLAGLKNALHDAPRPENSKLYSLSIVTLSEGNAHANERKSHRDSFSASLQEAIRKSSVSSGSCYTVGANKKGGATAATLSRLFDNRLRHHTPTVAIPPREAGVCKPAIFDGPPCPGNGDMGVQLPPVPPHLTNRNQSFRLPSLSNGKVSGCTFLWQELSLMWYLLSSRSRERR